MWTGMEPVNLDIFKAPWEILFSQDGQCCSMMQVAVPTAMQGTLGQWLAWVQAQLSSKRRFLKALGESMSWRKYSNSAAAYAVCTQCSACFLCVTFSSSVKWNYSKLLCYKIQENTKMYIKIFHMKLGTGEQPIKFISLTQVERNTTSTFAYD